MSLIHLKRNIEVNEPKTFERNLHTFVWLNYYTHNFVNFRLPWFFLKMICWNIPAISKVSPHKMICGKCVWTYHKYTHFPEYEVHYTIIGNSKPKTHGAEEKNIAPSYTLLHTIRPKPTQTTPQGTENWLCLPSCRSNFLVAATSNPCLYR